MPRRREVQKRETVPDQVYQDVIVAKFINCLMQRGKKSTAEQVMYKAFDIIKNRHKENPVEVFRKAIQNVSPRVEVRSRRVGGATYQVPVEVRSDRALALAMRWIKTYSQSRGEKTMREKLAAELIDAAAGRGNSAKKCEDTHRMAEANKAFSHYRW
ncbi:MAG: 30S ribosomal protein S7 [Deltaproteobacteria bacterium]|nr:30S ribosomal protein S7 [Deltaproteobacteria bacterium]